MHSISKSTLLTRRPLSQSAALSGPWCISCSVVGLDTRTPGYPAFLSEPKFATRNQEAGT